MITWEKSIFINRSQQEVWDFISNPANLAKWGSSTVSAEWISEGPHGVGSTAREVGKAMGRKVEGISEITVWDPPNKHARKYVSGPLQGEGTMKLEPKENGTQLTAYGQATFGGFLKIAEGLFAKLSKKQLDRDAETLKLLLEEGQA
jgi:carbon monoxide dehydrogenase subunit G